MGRHSDGEQRLGRLDGPFPPEAADHGPVCGGGGFENSFGPLGLGAYRNHKERLKDAQGLGSGFEKRVRADLEREAKVWRELGLDPDAEQASPEEKPGKEDGRGQDAA